MDQHVVLREARGAGRPPNKKYTLRDIPSLVREIESELSRIQQVNGDIVITRAGGTIERHISYQEDERGYPVPSIPQSKWKYATPIQEIPKTLKRFHQGVSGMCKKIYIQSAQMLLVYEFMHVCMYVFIWMYPVYTRTFYMKTDPRCIS